MSRTATRTALAALAVVLGTAGAEAQARESCNWPWGYRVGHWHYPEVVAELTQRTGPRSRADLDATARELVRSAAEPDADAVVETIRTHFADGIRSDYEQAIACAVRKGADVPDVDLDAAVARAVESQREDAARRAAAMANTTLQLAAHRGWRSSQHPPNEGIPYDGDGAFEAALLMFEQTGSDAGLLDELNPERAAAAFGRVALRPGPRACDALKRLRRWYRWESIGLDDERYGRPHASYESLRRESPERCPELDDPGG